MEITIESVNSEHTRRILEIEVVSNTFDDPDFGEVTDLRCWDLKQFQSYWKKKNTISLALKVDNNVVGFCMFDFDVKNSKLVVDKLVIDVNYRRNRLGTMLVEEILEKYKAKVYQFIVKETDRGSIEFFKSLNFKSRLAHNHFCKDEDAIIFYKTGLV